MKPFLRALPFIPLLALACGSAEPSPVVVNLDVKPAPSAPTLPAGGADDHVVAAGDDEPRGLLMTVDAGTIGLGGLNPLGHGAGTGTPGASPTIVQHPSTQPVPIRETVRRKYGQARRCYEAGLQKNAALEGRVVVKFTIGKDGVVTSAVDAGSTMPDLDVVACVVRVFHSLSFPPPAGGGVVTVTYPIEFEPAGVTSAPSTPARQP